MIKRKIKRNRKPRIKKRTRFLIDKKLLKKYGIDKLLNVKNSKLRDIRFYLNNTNKRKKRRRKDIVRKQLVISNRDELERESNMRAQIYRLERDIERQTNEKEENNKRETQNNVDEDKKNIAIIENIIQSIPKTPIKKEISSPLPNPFPRMKKEENKNNYQSDKEFNAASFRLRLNNVTKIFTHHKFGSRYFKDKFEVKSPVKTEQIYEVLSSPTFYNTIYDNKDNPTKIQKLLRDVETSWKERLNKLLVNREIKKKGEGYERHAFQRNEGMTNHQINKLMKKYNVPNYVGCVMSNEIHLLPKNKKKMCFIYNTDVSSGPGIHWCGVIITNRTLEYFDPLSNHIRRGFLKDIKKILKRNDIPPLLLKTNAIRDQRANSSNCGWFSCKFLVDRLIKNKPFSEATGYKSIRKAEKAIGIFRKKFSKII